MNKLFLSVCAVLSFFAAVAQTKTDSVKTTPADSVKWVVKNSLNFNFANVGLSNWAAGGQSTFSANALFDHKSDRESGKSHWSNSVNIGYGAVNVNKAGFRKTDDHLIMNIKYGYRFNEIWRLGGMIDFRTQMTNGFNTFKNQTGELVTEKISGFMAPGYLVTSFGIKYKRRKDFFVIFSPFATKSTIVVDDSLAAAYGVTLGDNFRTEMGFAAVVIGTFKIMDNVDFRTNLNLFSNYKTLPNSDVNWETMTVFKINKHINASFATQLIYDKDIEITKADGSSGPAVQFKHVLNLGVGFVF